MRIVATVCARMTSSRLPGKVLLPVAGKPALERLVERLARSHFVDEIVMATSRDAPDDPIAKLAGSMGVALYRGSLEDVLGRVTAAAKIANAELLVEVTGDMTLLDPGVIDHAVALYKKGDYNYITNVAYDPVTRRIRRSYPIGVNASVIDVNSLELMEREATDPAQREHVFLFAHENREKIKQRFFTAPTHLAHSDWRFALDYPSDYEFICAVYEFLLPTNPDFTYEDIVSFLSDNPHLLDINRDNPTKKVRG